MSYVSVACPHGCRGPIDKALAGETSEETGAAIDRVLREHYAKVHPLVDFDADPARGAEPKLPPEPEPATETESTPSLEPQKEE